MTQYPVTVNGVQRELYDDDTRTYSSWDEQGVLVESRAYSSSQNADADARLANESMATGRKVKSDRVSDKRVANVAFINAVPTQQQLVDQVKALTQQVIDITDLVLQSYDIE